MAYHKVLITVKTYPALSGKYDELVCTAGLLEDGSWIRIYPVPFRKLDYANQYKLWQWIEIDLVKNTSDFRIESYRPRDIDSEIRTLNRIGTENYWAKRKEIVFKQKTWTNMSELIAEAKATKMSLALFKPTEILDFIIEDCSRDWSLNKLKQIEAKSKMRSLFDDQDADAVFNVVNKLPYKFSYVFTSEDGKERTLMIEEWEIGALYWNCLKLAKGDEKIACQKVRQKYLDEFKKTDLYFFLGTSCKFHNVSPNPFMIIGTFRPLKEPINNQLSLFE